MLNYILAAMGQTKQTFHETYTKTVICQRKIPFIIEAPADPFYSKENIDRIRQSIAQLNAGKGTEHDLIEVDGCEKMAR